MPAKGYKDVLKTLADRIDVGTYPLHSKLPTLKEMKNEFEVSTSTVQCALRILEDRGAVVPKRGVGYYVVADTGQRRKPDSLDGDRSDGQDHP